MATDDLTATVHSALTALDPGRKAQFLLDTALTLIDAGRYGDDVEKYLDVYLKTPNLSKTSIAKALLARANARKACGDRLLAQAHQDFQAVLRLDPSNRDVANHIRRRTQIRFAHDPPSHRAPPEVWSRIATYIPRYHLRTWLQLSSFHRSIALRHIFHTIDLYFGEDQPENVNRSLDIFDRVKSDKSFALRVKCLRVHWAYEEGELLDLMVRVFRTALPEFIALKEFEWIGYPELRQDMVQNLLVFHPRLISLGSIGFHFDACGISSFNSLQKLTLRAEDDDGYADWSEITTVLNNNTSTLKHLILGAYLHRQHSWDATFSSPTIHNLTHLDLVDTRISHTVLSRIAHAAGGVGGRLESLTLHGILEEPGKAAVIFGSDEVINGEHTFLPRLNSFRFLLVGQPQVITPPPAPPPQQQQYYHPQEHYDPTILHLYQTITQFLRNRSKLRRLDLGNCPWEYVAPILPGLKGLRVLGVRIGCLVRGCGNGVGTVSGGTGVDLNGCTSEVDVLIKSLPSQVGALRVEVGVSELPLHVYANQFQKFKSLSFLHLQLHNAQLAYHPLPAPPPPPPVPQQYQPHHPQQYYPYQQPHPIPPPQRQQQPQQPSYHPFPPHPPASTSTSTSSGVQTGPGTPKRRNGPKRDGMEHEGVNGENDDSGASGNGSGESSTQVGSGSQQSVMGPPPPRGHQTVYAHPQPHGQPPLQLHGTHHHHHQFQQQQQQQQQPPPPLPPVQQQYVPQPVPPQPLGTLESAKHVASIVDSLDFVGWNGELYVIVRGTPHIVKTGLVTNVDNTTTLGGVVRKVDAGVEAGGIVVTGPSRTSASASPILRTDISRSSPSTNANTNTTTNANTNANANTTGGGASTTPAPPTPQPQQLQPQPQPLPQQQEQQQQQQIISSTVELKELPSRRRLDCGKGVDLGSDDAVWLERKDVPMDYDMPVGSAET